MHGTCSSRLAKVFQFILDAIILIILISSAMGITTYPIEIYNIENTNFEDVQNTSFLKIATTAEELLAKQISDEIESEFSKRPSFCQAEFDTESFKLSSLKIYFSREDMLTSAYEVKEFIKERYFIKAEVMFE